jgi:hypothetical protein
MRTKVFNAADAKTFGPEGSPVQLGCVMFALAALCTPVHAADAPSMSFCVTGASSTTRAIPGTAADRSFRPRFHNPRLYRRSGKVVHRTVLGEKVPIALKRVTAAA